MNTELKPKREYRRNMPEFDEIKLHKHGLHGTKEYKTWIQIKNRCYNTNNPYYHLYGGRGIGLSDEFKLVANFCNYIKTLPNYQQYLDGGLSLDRIENDKNYERGNLRFATQQVQVLNQGVKKTSKTGVNGVFYRSDRVKKKYIASIRINSKQHYIGAFASLEEAKIAYDSHPKVAEKLKILKAI